MQEIEIWPYEKMVYAQTNICSEERDTQTPVGFWHRNGSPNLGLTTKPYHNQKKKKNKKKNKKK